MVAKLEKSVRKTSRLGHEVVWINGWVKEPTHGSPSWDASEGERKLLSSLILDNVMGIEAS